MRSNRANIGFFICQEVLYPEISRNLVNEGAEILITIGNDGVFTNPTAAKINHKTARMRAIESQRYLIRSMKSGISSVIKPTGLVRSKTQINENTVLFSKAYKANKNTASTYHKTYWIWEFVWAILLALLLFISTTQNLRSRN